MDLNPRIIFWETTRRCNLKCGYCRMLDSASGSELDTPEALKIVADIKDAFGSPVLVLSGGEPLLRKDIFGIISYATGLGLQVALATNGVLLGEKEVSILRERRIKRVSISLDSVDQKAHDLSRGVTGAFAKSITAAGILKKQKVPFQINYTVTSKNIHQISQAARLAVSLGAIAVHYFVVVPVGCGKKIEKDTALDAVQSDEALSLIRDLSRSMPIEIRPTCAPQYVRYAQKGSYGGCLAGTGTFFISSEGGIYPCGYLPVKAGSLRINSIGDIWKDSAVFRNLRLNNFKGSCAGCDIKDSCRGCRARAFAATGDYMAADTSCVQLKEAVTA